MRRKNDCFFSRNILKSGFGTNKSMKKEKKRKDDTSNRSSGKSIDNKKSCGKKLSTVYH